MEEDCLSLPSNVEICLGPLSEQLSVLFKTKWNGKKIRAFLTGDYCFLCQVYGLSGAKGVYCCLWCFITSKEMQLDPEDREDDQDRRTLKYLHKHHQRFLEQANGDKTKAKLHYNVVEEPILPFQLDHVSPPELHIRTGITKKCHDLLLIDLNSIELGLGHLIIECRPERIPLFNESHREYYRFLDALRNEIDLNRQKTELASSMQPSKKIKKDGCLRQTIKKRTKSDKRG